MSCPGCFGNDVAASNLTPEIPALIPLAPKTLDSERNKFGGIVEDELLLACIATPFISVDYRRCRSVDVGAGGRSLVTEASTCLGIRDHNTSSKTPFLQNSGFGVSRREPGGRAISTMPSCIGELSSIVLGMPSLWMHLPRPPFVA